MRCVVLLLLAAASAQADTLFFLASIDAYGHVNTSWFSSGNWYYAAPGGGYINAYRLPVPGDTAVLKSSVNAAGNNIYISTLVTGRNNVIGGNFIVNVSLQTSAGTSFTDSSLDIQSQWLASGDNYLTGSSITVDAGASLQISKGSLNLTDSDLYNVGQILLTDQATLSFAGGTNRFTLLPNAVLSGTGTNWVVMFGNAGDLTIFDNDGVVRCDSGTLHLNTGLPNNIVWTNSHNVGKFKTTAANATIEVDGTLTVPAGMTYLFSGPGRSRLTDSTTTVNGVLSVGVVDPASHLIDVGTLEVIQEDLAGPGLVHVVASNGFSSALNLIGGSNVRVATVTIDPAGQLNLNTATNGDVALWGVTINNGGTTTWSGDNSFRNAFGMYNNATFNNLAGALFDAQNDAAIMGGAGTNDGTFNNAGIFRKSAGTNDTYFWYSSSPGVTFNNMGLLDVQTGRVVLMGGTNSSQFNVAAGARLRFWHSPYILSAGATFTGAGSVALGGNAPTLLVNTDVRVGNFLLASDESATLDGPGALTLTGASTWSGGVMQGTGALNIAANATLTLGGVGVTVNQRTINNAGTVNCTYGFNGGKGAVFNNLPGGVLNLQVSNMGFDYSGSGVVPVLNNAGTVVGPVGFWPNMNWAFTNSGSVLAQGANLNLGRGLTQIAGSTVVAAGATLTPGRTAPLLLQGGILSGYGTIAGPVVNGATISFGATPGVLQLNGGFPKYYTQNSNGVLAIKIGGHTAGTQFDQLAVINNGSAALGGTLAVSFINGFVPALGDSFPVVTFGSSSAAFAIVTGNRAGNGLVLVPRNTGTSVTLVAAHDPQLSAPAFSGGRYDFTVNTTTGFSYVVEYAGSLTPPVPWQTLTNIVGNGLPVSVVDPAPPGPQRFYRARFQ